METNETPVDRATPASSQDTSKVLKTRQNTKLTDELEAHLKKIWRVAESLFDAANSCPDNRETAVEAKKEIKKHIDNLWEANHCLSLLAEDARTYFGVAEESDGTSKRKPPTRKRKSSAAPARANKKKTISKRKAGNSPATRLSSPSSSSEEEDFSSEQDSSSSSSSSEEESSSSSGESDEIIEQSEDENEGPREDSLREDTPATTASPQSSRQQCC